MKKKTKNIVLLTLAVLIWIIVGLQVYNTIGNEQTIPGTFQKHTLNTDQFKKEKISYDLQLNYEDPFRVEKKVIKKKPVKKKIITTPKIVKQIKPVSWGKVIYYGMFSNNSTSKQMGSGNFQGFTTTFTEGDTVMGITVVKIYPDSIQLLKEGELKYFTK